MIYTEAAYNYLEGFINKVRAKGRFLFTLQEVREAFDISDQAIKKSLKRLKDKRKIAMIRKGFYSIVPPEYTSLGIVPPHLFADDMMAVLNKKYYVGMFSAAAIHGAAHQQPMEYFIITEYPSLRDINNDNLKLYYPGFGTNKVFTVIQELAETMRPSVLASCAKRFPQVAVIQRLGYLLEEKLGQEKLGNSLFNALEGKRSFPVLLAKSGSKEGPTNRRWKVIVNTTVEGDL